jgi:hypothetical protein
VVAAGVTETGEPKRPPGFQAYVVPTTLLVADKEEEAPLQIIAGVAVGVITGIGLTVTVTVADPVQPTAEPVTV